jgi:hypothetical protein
MLLSQSGIQLYEAVNEDIINEVRNDDFPFSENEHYNTNPDKASDAKHLDNLVREFLNKVDKALVKVHNETELKCVVIATEDNYSRLQQVTDKPSIYLGYANIDYNKVNNTSYLKTILEIGKRTTKTTQNRSSYITNFNKLKNKVIKLFLCNLL